MTSGWFINSIELPIAPTTESKTIARTFQQESIFRQFPQLSEPAPASFTYVLTGYIFGNSVIEQLEQLAKSADTELVVVIPPNDRLRGTVLDAGKFAISNFTVNRDKYTITEVNGRTELVYKYTLALTQFAGEGINDNSIELETLEGEEFIGIGDELNGDDINAAIVGYIDNFPNVLIDSFLTI